MLYLKKYPYKAVIIHFVLFNTILSFLLAGAISVLLKFDSSRQFVLHDFLVSLGENFLYLFFIPTIITTIFVSIFKIKDNAIGRKMVFLITFLMPSIIIWITTCAFQKEDACFIGISIIYFLCGIPIIINSMFQIYWLKKIFREIN
jgi:hypothetical protein